MISTHLLPRTVTLHVMPHTYVRATRKSIHTEKMKGYHKWRDKVWALMLDEGMRPPLVKYIDELRVTFHIAMPRSWSQKKKDAKAGQPHQQKPDLDNLVKALMDVFGRHGGDEHIWKIEATKLWCPSGKIDIAAITHGTAPVSMPSAARPDREAA